MELVYGTRYRIRRINDDVLEGVLVQTKGNDEYFPTFELDDGSLLGIHHSNVLGEVDDSCPVNGIERSSNVDSV